MSTLTKVFVVLLVVFSIAFSMMTVSIVAQTTNWKQNAERYSDAARVANTNLANLHAIHAAELATSKETIQSLIAEQGRLETDKKAALNELDATKLELAQVLEDKRSVDAMNGRLVRQLESAEARLAAYVGQRDELEKRDIELERRNIDLNDRVNEQTATIAVLVEQQRQFEQQIHILKTENERLARVTRGAAAGLALEDAAGVALPGVAAMSPVAHRAIRGRVVEVSGNVVTVSVGSADGVEKDMVFVIHRDGQYVGDLRITHVRPDESAGRIERSLRGPIPNDDVTDAVTLASAGG